MAALGSDGSLVLTAAEAAQLQNMVRRWERAAEQMGADTATPLVDLGDAGAAPENASGAVGESGAIAGDAQGAG